MTERTRSLVVGLTTLVALVGLAVMLMLFGYVPRFLRPSYPLSVLMDDATGLSLGGRVQMRGIDVGTIESIGLQDGGQQPTVRLVLAIDRHINVPKGAVASSEPPLLGSTPALRIDVSRIAPSDTASALPKDGSAVIPGEFRPLPRQLASQLGTTASQFGERFAELNRQFDRIADSFVTLSDEWRQVGKNVNQLLEPRSASAVDQGQAPANLSTLVARTDDRLRELRSITQSLDQLLGDPKMRDDVRAAVAHFRSMGEKLDRTAGDVGKLVGQTQEQFGQLAARYVAVADELGKSIATLQKSLDQAASKEGTLGKLLSDPSLYDNLNDLATRASSAAKELELLLEKWQNEGVPLNVK